MQIGIEIAICDDEERMCQDIRQRVIDLCPGSKVKCFSSGKELLEEENVWDIVFLDIGMEGENGIEVARELSRSPGTLLIFVTAYENHVFEAFDVGAFHYLLKPLDEEKFSQVLLRAVGEVHQRKARSPLQIKEGSVYRLIKPEDIYYAESSGRKILLNTGEGKVEFYGRMQELEQRLGEDFFRCHRGYLVHLKYVTGYDNADIYLKNGHKVYLAKQKYAEFVSCYMAYLRRVEL